MTCSRIVMRYQRKNLDHTSFSRWSRFWQRFSRFAPNWLLVVVTAAAIPFFCLQYKSVENQTIAVMNNPANRPKLVCSAVVFDRTFLVNLINEGALCEKLSYRAKQCLQVWYKGPPKIIVVGDIPPTVHAEQIETSDKMNLNFALPVNLSKILNSCDTSKEVMLKPFVIVQVTYCDMFKRGSVKYFWVSGKSLPEKGEDQSGKKKVPRKGQSFDFSDLGYSAFDWGAERRFDSSFDAAFDMSHDSGWWDSGWDSGWRNGAKSPYEIPQAEGERFFSVYDKSIVFGEDEVCSHIAKLVLKEKR